MLTSQEAQIGSFRTLDLEKILTMFKSNLCVRKYFPITHHKALQLENQFSGNCQGYKLQRVPKFGTL